MIRLENFRVYSNDTKATILERIAALDSIDTLPKYVNIEPKGILDDIIAIRTSGKIDCNAMNILNVPRSFLKSSEMKVIVEQNNLNFVDDVVKPWFFLHFNTENIEPEFMNMIVHNDIDDITGEIVDFFPNYLSERDDFIHEFRNSKQINIAKVTQFDTEVRIHREIQGVFYTQFELEKNKILFETNISDMSIIEVFDNIVLDNKVPFANMGGKYYKILKDSTPEPEWSTNLSDDYIRLIIAGRKDLTVDLAIHEKNLVILAEIQHTTREKEAEVHQCVMRILSNISVQVTDKHEVFINGVFYIPNQSIDTYIFSHLVMNDPMFSANLAIDEFDKATKTKDGIYTYYNSGTEEISTVITSKKMNASDATMKGKNKSVFPEGKSYIRVKISRCKNEKSVSNFQEYLSKMITLYNLQYKTLADFYREYIPQFGEQAEDLDMNEQYYKDINPELFSTTYTRKCPVQPDIHPEDDHRPYQSSIIFPKDSAEGPRFLYTCDGKKKPFVGLQLNPGMKYEYVPCCFTDSQKMKRGSKYNSYYNPAKFHPKKTQQSKVISTNKILEYGIIGSLEPFAKTNRFFSLFQDAYLRYGVDRSPMSFLQCVMTAVNGENVIEMSAVIKERDRICGFTQLMSSARQQFPDKSPEDIRDTLLSDSTYIDPKLYLNIIETFYRCKIFIFSNIGLEIPIHLKNLLCHHREDDIIIILEHMGSESDAAEYPQCELIIRFGKTPLYRFEYRDEVSENLRLLFSKMTSSYMLNKHVKPYVLEREFEGKIAGQVINSYGKSVAIITRFDNVNVILYTEQPIAPIDALENLEYEIPSMEMLFEILAKIFPEKNRNRYSKIVDASNTIQGLVLTTYNNNKYIIPVLPHTDVESITSKSEIVLPSVTSVSFIEAFNMYKKLSVFLCGYMLYLFSAYISDNKLELSDRTVSDFVREKILIVPYINYGMISKKFNTNEGGFIRDGKFVLKTEEVLKRLVYVLRLEIFRNPSKVIDYHLKKIVENSISNISDFELYPSQIIIEGEESLEKYIKEKNMVFTLEKDVVKDGAEQPYFSEFMDIVYLAENVHTIQEARSLQYNWNTLHYNTVQPLQDARVDIGLYVFENADNTDLVHGTEQDPKVLGYKINGEDTHTVLLTLD